MLKRRKNYYIVTIRKSKVNCEKNLHIAFIFSHVMQLTGMNVMHLTPTIVASRAKYYIGLVDGHNNKRNVDSHLCRFSFAYT